LQGIAVGRNEMFVCLFVCLVFNALSAHIGYIVRMKYILCRAGGNT